MSAYSNQIQFAIFPIQDKAITWYLIAALVVGMTFLLPSGAAAESTPKSAIDTSLEMRVHFYNVGAGTCTLIECPGEDAQSIIIDCGTIDGDWNEEGPKAMELRERIQKTIAGRSTEVVLSHSDKDHVSLIPYVLENVPVSAIWQGDDSEDYPSYIQNWVSNQNINKDNIFIDLERN